MPQIGQALAKYTLYQGDTLAALDKCPERFAVIFADPPDGIGMKYDRYSDDIPTTEYVELLEQWLNTFLPRAKTTWLSYNAKWNFEIGRIVSGLQRQFPKLRCRLCIQHYTFGQHSQHDLANDYRPLLRMCWEDAVLYPDDIRVESWRQANGDKRADPRGRVPSDVMDFPRVTGNSHQRREWMPNQLHEGLVERCLRLTSKEGDTVYDAFMGSATVLRVCKRIKRRCIMAEREPLYCQKVLKEHPELRCEKI